MRIRAQEPGEEPDSETGEWACSSLEGGFTTPFDTFGYSGRPCATRLSVPGLLALLRLLPGRKRFLSQGEEAPFCAEDPLSHGMTSRSVNGLTTWWCVSCHHGVQGGMYRAGYTYQGIPGGIYQVGYTTRVYREAYTSPTVKRVIQGGIY